MNKITSRLGFAATLGVVAFASQARAQFDYIDVTAATFTGTITPGAGSSGTGTGGTGIYNQGSIWDSYAALGTETNTGLSEAVNFGGAGVVNGATIAAFEGNAPTIESPLPAPATSVSGSADLIIGSFAFANSSTAATTAPILFNYDVASTNLYVTTNTGTYALASADLAQFSFSLTSNGTTDSLKLVSVDFYPGSASAALWTPSPATPYPVDPGADLVQLTGVNGTTGSIQAGLFYTFEDSIGGDWNTLETGGSVTFASQAATGSGALFPVLTSLGTMDLDITAPYYPTPEPSTYALWGAALLLAVVAYRRMAAAKASVAMV